MKRAPRHYQLFLNGKPFPRRLYRFRDTAINKALALLVSQSNGDCIEIVTKSGKLSWWGTRRQSSIAVSGV